ncbi:hypothetical protein C8J57DRAFT_418596 [Mycena rebaudengoi]|nr:hypothetical protein C8J57DRAFT_418596 [Mycena rebaudengoi]
MRRPMPCRRRRPLLPILPALSSCASFPFIHCLPPLSLPCLPTPLPRPLLSIHPLLSPLPFILFLHSPRLPPPAPPSRSFFFPPPFHTQALLALPDRSNPTNEHRGFAQFVHQADAERAIEATRILKLGTVELEQSLTPQPKLPSRRPTPLAAPASVRAKPERRATDAHGREGAPHRARRPPFLYTVARRTRCRRAPPPLRILAVFAPSESASAVAHPAPTWAGAARRRRC